MADTIKPKRGLLSTANSSSTVLYKNEMLAIAPDTGVGTGGYQIKFGDGTTTVPNLPIAIDGAYVEDMKSMISVTLSSSSWSGSSAPYSQTVSNSSLKADYNYELYSALADGTAEATAKAYNKAFTIISQGTATTSDGSVTFKVYKKPSTSISVYLRRA